MSIFSSIMSKIFHHGSADAAGAAAPDAAAAQPASAPAAAASAAPAQSVDVGAVLADMAKGNSQQLNYQTSIVDLLKLLNLDSSLEARKSLAGELGYTGSTDDSATMNVWLHKQVMTKLEQNGGKVPAELKGA